MEDILRTLKSVPGQAIAYGVLIETFVEPLYKSKQLSPSIYNKVKDEFDFLRKRKQRKNNGIPQETNRGGGEHHPSRPSQVDSRAHADQVDGRRNNANVDSMASADLYYNGQMNRDSNNANVESLKIKLEKYKESNRRLGDDTERVNVALMNAKEEENALRSRLSKYTGDKLINPNITDLSDVYRPTNLGNQFSELFDNDWSDAFKEIDKLFRDERKSVELLHDLVQKSFLSCERKAKVQEERIKDILLDVKEFNANNNVDNLHNMLIEVRKDILPRSSVNVAKNYTTGELSQYLLAYDIKNPGKKLVEFAQKCTELCWCMHMCDPPMDMTVGQRGQPFDINVYKKFKISFKNFRQPIVEYFVWPPLRLNVGGQLVSMGIAQPCEKQGKQK